MSEWYQTIDIRDPRSLSQALQLLVTPEPFVLSKFFKTEAHAADAVDIEIRRYNAHMAQLVSKNGMAKPVKKIETDFQTVRLPRTKETKVFTARELAEIEALGQLWDESPAGRINRADQRMLEELTDLKNRVVRLREYMAIKAITTGAISITADGVKLDFDYGFKANKQLFTLDSDHKWNASSTTKIDILSDIVTMKKYLTRAGYNGDNLLLGETAAADFRANEKIVEQLWATRFNIGQVDMTKIPTVGSTYMGNLVGVDIWEVSQQYLDGTTPTNMFGANLAVMLPSINMACRLHLGPVYQLDLSGKPVISSPDFMITPDIDDDIIEWKCEQCSLPVVHDPGAVVVYTVHV